MANGDGLGRQIAAEPADVCRAGQVDAVQLLGHRIATAAQTVAVALVDQDRSKWDRALVMEGEYLLNLSARGDELSEFHLEAAIAHVHLSAPSAADTQWSVIVGLYDRLLAIRPSPVISLNRAIAVAQAEGPERGREALLSIPGRERLETYPFYAAALGEIELRCGNATAAHEHYRTAIALARSPMERRFLQTRAVRSLPIDA